ncbi:hypothetical protein ACHAPK_011823, partial [Fusarium culmorum]
MSTFRQDKTQEGEVHSGYFFYPSDRELVLERKRCSAAVSKFTNLNGISAEERARLFRGILQPRVPVRVSPAEASLITNFSCVGRNVAVSTPFACDYGYNIKIGKRATIRRNCTINDVCEVNIGDGCVLSPNVSICTVALSVDPDKRRGSQGRQIGKSVTIEQNCWIGGCATILLGVRIGKGSTVGAGSIVIE